MAENYFVMMRKRKKQDLLKFLKDNPDMDLTKAIAIFSMKTGFRLSTIRHYYDELVQAGLIEERV